MVGCHPSYVFCGELTSRPESGPWSRSGAIQIAGCALCLGFHTRSARRAAVSEETLDLLAGWADASVFTAEERAALALTEEAARIRDGRRISDDTWRSARDHFSDAELAALLYTIGLIKLWNTLNVATELPVDGQLPTPPRSSL